MGGGWLGRHGLDGHAVVLEAVDLTDWGDRDD